MNVFVINNNEYSLKDPSFVELITDEVNSASKVKLIVVYGLEDAFLLAKQAFINYNILYLGYSPLNEDDLFICLTFFSLSNNFAIPDGYYLPDNSLKYFNRHFDDRLVRSYLTREPDCSLFSNSAGYISSIVERIKFAVNSDSIEHIKNQVDFDIFLLDLVSYKIAKCEYADINKGLFNAARNKTITEHIFYIAATKEKLCASWQRFFHGISLYKRLASNKDIEFLLFYYHLFRFSAISYKNWWNSSICYSFLLRAFEVLITFYGLKSGAIIEHQGELIFSDSSEKINGVRKLADYAVAVSLIEAKSKIYKLITIRNNSLLGHGFYKPSLDIFDDIFLELSILFKTKIDNKPLKLESSGVFHSMFALTTKTDAQNSVRSLWKWSHVIS